MENRDHLLKLFYVKFPLDFYPISFWAENEQHARSQARNWLGKNRLPNGTDVWEVDVKFLDWLAEENARQGFSGEFS